MPEKSSNTAKVYYPEFNKQKIIDHIRKRIEKIRKSLPLTSVTIFGSYASGRQTAASDIDLLIIYADPKKEDAYSRCWDALQIPQLELHIYNKSEYETLKSSGSTFAKEAQDKGLIIWQFEKHKPRLAQSRGR